MSFARKPITSINQGQSLLVEWPRGDDMTTLCSRKAVAFSEYSELKLYHNGSRSNKYYSSADRKNFRMQAVQDAHRVRNLIASCGVSTGSAILQVVELGLIEKEHLVGIEDLVNEKAAAEIVQRRKVHVASVLEAQRLIQKRKRKEVDTVLLAKIAGMSSSKSVEKAWLRAAWSLDAGRIDTGKSMHVPATSRRRTTTGKAFIQAAYAA
jgi:hypothetical protein